MQYGCYVIFICYYSAFVLTPNSCLEWPALQEFGSQLSGPGALALALAILQARASRSRWQHLCLATWLRKTMRTYMCPGVFIHRRGRLRRGQTLFETERTVEGVGLSKHLGEVLQGFLGGCGERRASLHQLRTWTPTLYLQVGETDRVCCQVHNTYSISVSWGHWASIWHSLVTSSGPTLQSLRLKQTKHSGAKHFPWPQYGKSPFISRSLTS